MLFPSDTFLRLNLDVSVQSFQRKTLQASRNRTKHFRSSSMCKGWTFGDRRDCRPETVHCTAHVDDSVRWLNMKFDSTRSPDLFRPGPSHEPALTIHNSEKDKFRELISHLKDSIKEYRLRLSLLRRPSLREVLHFLDRPSMTPLS